MEEERKRKEEEVNYDKMDTTEKVLLRNKGETSLFLT